MSDLTREEMNARLETIETRMDARLSSLENMIATKFAEFDVRLQKANADTIKWVAGTVISIGAVGLALMTFLINNASPRIAPAPPIVITMPLHESAVPPPPVPGTPVP